MRQEILLIPQKADEERQSVLNAWIKLGGDGRKLDKFWEIPADLKNRKVAIYGNDTFALVLAQLFSIDLISPDDSLIARLDKKWTKRTINIKQIGELKKDDFPTFIKPVTPKQFKGKIYSNITEFVEETNGLNQNEKILVSEIIPVDAEARSFILNNELLDIAIYEGQGPIEIATKFLLQFIKSTGPDLPKTLVVDVGYNSNLGWFIIEFNSSWGAGLNYCDPEKVIEAIISATLNRE